MSDEKESVKKIKLASQEALRFVGAIADQFLEEVLDHPEALVTDLSTLHDFCDYDAEKAIGPGKKSGTFRFRIRRRLSTNADWEEIEIETEAKFFRKDIIERTRTVFGVDITSVFDLRLPEIFRFIAAHKPSI
ncbi:MAG: hypothetical protein JSR44_14345 [Spirochaetes bacterium]|nr:hypothetical protein [Spirochaetota bacterium]